MTTVRDVQDMLKGKHPDAPVTIRTTDSHFSGAELTSGYAVSRGDDKGEMVFVAGEPTDRKHAL